MPAVSISYETYSPRDFLIRSVKSAGAILVDVRSDQQQPERKQSTPVSDQHPVGQKLWNLAKPLITTYIGQQIYKRLSQSIRSARSVESQSL
jgi:hypothetical protein